MAFYILRNDTEYGPYDIAVIKQYVDNGKILKHDQAKDASNGRVNTVGYYLKKAGIKSHIKSKGSFVDQLRGIGSQLILPIGLLKNRQWLSDKRLLLLALIGLGPSTIMLLPIGGFMVFYAVALYLSAIWGLLFY